MRTEVVHFYSAGLRLRGLLRLPDASRGDRLPTTVQGFLGLAESPHYERYDRGLTDAGRDGSRGQSPSAGPRSLRSGDLP